MISLSPLSFMESKAKWNTTVHDNEDRYNRPSFRQRLLPHAIIPTILRYIPIHQLNSLCDYYPVTFSHMMSMNGSPPKTTNMAPTSMQFGEQQLVLATGPGLDRKNGSVRFQNHPRTRPADSWRAKPGPIPVNPRVSLGLARPVGSNLQFCVSGFTFMVACRYATVNRRILTLVRHGSFSTY
jgi:hypothetical protein